VKRAARAFGDPEEVDNGQQAVALARELQSHVIVMDGIKATRQILAEIPGMKILALSIYSDDRFNSCMMRDGAL